MRFRTFLLVVALLISLTLGSISTFGQETIITLSVPQWQADSFPRSLFTDFETANPGVKVVVVASSRGFANAAGALDEHLEGFAEFVSAGDVVAISNYMISTEATLAGYLLDLTPLVQSDPDFNPDDFFPGAWRAYQWDNGIWAIPSNLSVELLVYDANAFDEAGLTYPNESWTFDMLADAARQLVERDSDGNVILPGLTVFDASPLFRSALGKGFADNSVVPSVPQLDSPELTALIETYSALLDEGVIQSFGDFDRSQVAMTVEQPWRLSSFSAQQNTEQNLQVSLLPGGSAPLSVEAYGVSGGTSHPELAYELVKYLTSNPAITNRFGATPARRSLLDAELEGVQFAGPGFPEEVQAVINQGLENGFGYSELRFSDYLNPIVFRFPGGEQSTVPTLAELQQRALDNLEAAAAKRGSQTLAVATPVPTPVIQAGETVLTFRVQVPYSPLPNRERWDEVLAEFAAEDPTVGNVDLLTGFGMSPEDQTQPDCYFNSGSGVMTLDLSTILSINPFMDADPDFDTSDLLPGVMDQITRDGSVWGYPISISPYLMAYNITSFEEAGLPLPRPDWTVDEFLDALNTLKSANPDLQYVFQSTDFGSSYLLQLFAAFGGHPIDYSTTPTTVSFTDETNIEAIRQVLDLTHNGLMGYTRLDNVGGGGGGGGAMPLSTASSVSLAFDLSFRMSSEGGNSTQGYVLFPRGSQYTPVAYVLGTGFINATAQNPEDCYRLLKKIGATPDLLLGMPVQRSQLANIETLLGEDIAQVYQTFANTLEAPNALILPDPYNFSGGSSNSFGAYVESVWINRAFDTYVLDDGDLETVLADTERLINEYRACTPAEEPELSQTMPSEEILAAFEMYTDCAVQVDPSLAPRFTAPE